MPTYLDIAKFVAEFDMLKSLNRVFQSKEIQSFVINSIRKRLYAQGITGSELKLKTDKGSPFYTDAYVKVKKRKGEKTSNVTLFLSGGYYQSFKFVLIKTGWRVDADWGFVSVHFKNLYSSEAAFQQDTMSLTDNELRTMMNVDIQPEILKDFHETIYRP